MAHYAKVDSNNIVTDLKVVANADILDENGVEVPSKGVEILRTCENDPNANWIQYSINASNGEREEDAPVGSDGSTTALRHTAPGIGDSYDPDLDIFKPTSRQPFPSWTMDSNWVWQPPVPEPTEEQRYYGSEPFTSVKVAYNETPVRLPLVDTMTVTNPETTMNEVIPVGRIRAEWDETNQVWKGLHNDGTIRTWDGTSWNIPL